MRPRGIAETSVRSVLTAPDTVEAADRQRRRVFQGIVSTGDPAFRALLRVVIHEADSSPTVVTVHGTTPFRRYGAEPWRFAETDTLTLRLCDSPVRESAEDRSGVILHYDADGRLAALEILGASRRVDRPTTVDLEIVPARSPQLAAAE
jgi:uncharacterized protein YuzE